MTTFLFLIAALALIFFVIIKIIDPSSDKPPSSTHHSYSSDPEKEWNIGSWLLRLGPLITGFGLFGLLVDNFWEEPGARLLLLLLITILAIGGSLVLYTFHPENKNYRVFAEALLILSSFLIGATLVSVNDYTQAQNQGVLLGLSQLFGLWFLSLLPIAYLSRSVWILGINLFISIFWFAIYLDQKFNFIDVLGINLPNSTSSILFLVLPLLSATALSLLYGWHQQQKHNQPHSPYRPFYYLIGLMAFLNAGALVFQGINSNLDIFKSLVNNNAEVQTQQFASLIKDIIIGVTGLLVFLVDFISKRTIQRYNINFLAPLFLWIAAAVGLFFEGRPFLGFMFLEIPYIVWLLADFLRQRSNLSQLLFFGFSALQLFTISTDSNPYNWFKLLVLLGILMYAAIVHYHHRGLVFYVIFAGIVSLVFKVLAANPSGFLLITVVGVILMAFGTFYTITRTRMLEDKQTNSQDSPEEPKD